MPEQNGRCFADIFKCIFLNEDVFILNGISLKFVPKGQNENKSIVGLGHGLAPNRR